MAYRTQNECAIRVGQEKSSVQPLQARVSFEEALTVFSDPLTRIFEGENHSTEEQREIIIGHSSQGRLLVVCFMAQAGSVRIFSARTATRRERKDYEENVKR
jgi:uncharacterized DUF497 family protein